MEINTSGTWRRWPAVLLVSLLAAATGGPARGAVVGDGDRPGAGGAVIRRTAHGIPHILATDYRGLGLGSGYASAEQNLCLLAEDVQTLAGRRSRWFGADEANLAADIHHTWVNESRVVERLLAAPAPIGPSPQAKELVRGYAAGYNRFLAERTTAGLPDPACRGADWVRPITEHDIWRRAYRIAEHNGAEAATAQIAAAVPPAQTARPRSPRPRSPRWAGPRPGPASNAIAIGRAASASRTGLLLANPHLSWTDDLRLVQQQLTIPGELDVSGAGFVGLPVVNMGHTDRLAWTHTASTAQTTTLTRLTLVPGDPTGYLVDGVPHRMDRTRVTVPVRGADDRLRPVAHTLYRTPAGPVVAGEGLEWTATTAYVLNDANADNLRLIDQSLALGRSHDVGQLRAALNNHVGMPWAYTVAADATGTAFFSGVQVVPHVTDELVRRCAGGADNPVILDGSRSDCRWGDDADAPAPGLFGPARLPTLTRADTVANMNDSPWLTNPAAPLTGYPTVVGDTGTPRIARTRLGLDMIADRRGGTDGLGPPGFTLDTLQRTMLGNRNIIAEQGRAAVVAMCRAHPWLRGRDGDLVDVRAACRSLAGWDGRGDLDSRGAYLWQKFVQLAQLREVDLDAVPFSPAEPWRTPRGVAADRPAVREAFADVVQLFATAGVPVDVPLRRLQHYAGVPIHGCDVGCFNIVMDDTEPGTRLPDVSYGSTFIMAVELTATGPHTRTILTYGQSGDVTSEFHTDQARLYAAKRWVTGRFTAAEIRADPALTVRTLSGRDRS